MPSLREVLAAAAKEKQQAGLKVSSEKPVDTTPAPTPKPGPADDPRLLGNTEKGQDVPFEFPSDKKSAEERFWLKVRQQPHMQLAVTVEPGENPQHAWIVVQNPAEPLLPAFLFRLPLVTATFQDAPF